MTKVKTLVACTLTAAALPLGSALAQNAQPGGPQGTGWYGAPNAAVPVPQIVYPYISAPTAQRARMTEPRTDIDARPAARFPDRERWVLQGNSFDTNPPAPAP